MKVFSIGRSRENDVCINDPKVSRHHCQIMQDNHGKCSVIDLNSTNGTFVNGRRITGQVKLQSKDTIRIGSTTLAWRSYLGLSKTTKNKTLSTIIGIASFIALIALSIMLVFKLMGDDNGDCSENAKDELYTDIYGATTKPILKTHPNEERIALDLVGHSLSEGREDGYYPQSWLWKICDGEISNLKILSVEEDNNTNYSIMISMRLSSSTRAFECKALVVYKYDRMQGWQLEMVKSRGMDIVKTHRYDECITTSFDAGFQIYKIEDGPEYTMYITNGCDVSLEVGGSYLSYYGDNWKRFCIVVPPNSQKTISSTRQEVILDYVERP